MYHEATAARKALREFQPLALSEGTIKNHISAILAKRHANDRTPAVLAEGHVGDWFAGIAGVSIYLMPPGGGNQLARSYGEVALAQPSLRWLEFLQAYHAHLR